MAGAYLALLLLVISLSWAYGDVLEVCNGEVILEECSNCCSLQTGCVYLEPGSGTPTCLGGTKEDVFCTLDCQGARIKVCPDLVNLGRQTTITVLPDNSPRTGCQRFNLTNAAPQGNEIEECLSNAVQVCNGEVQRSECGICCDLRTGCMDLGSEKSVCIPTDTSRIPCPRILCPLPIVSACSNPGGASLDFASCHSCKNPQKPNCKLYDRATGNELCLENSQLE